MAHDTLMLIAQLSGLRINVLVNRLICDTEFARRVHSKLAGALAAMIEDQRKIFTAERVRDDTWESTRRGLIRRPASLLERL
ncbi:hypothetical protein [Aquamicrobium soli]|jgi:hypothetical protein|uniref:Uncharacterized protein n=1 Tax=Aquamicrobium soli TaxID=1811518 RepID=A0ABV7KIR0_9HYPH